MKKIMQKETPAPAIKPAQPKRPPIMPKPPGLPNKPRLKVEFGGSQAATSVFCVLCVLALSLSALAAPILPPVAGTGSVYTNRLLVSLAASTTTNRFWYTNASTAWGDTNATHIKTNSTAGRWEWRSGSTVLATNTINRHIGVWKTNGTGAAIYGYTRVEPITQDTLKVNALGEVTLPANFWEANWPIYTAVIGDSNAFGKTVPVTMTNEANQFTGSLTGTASGNATPAQVAAQISTNTTPSTTTTRGFQTTNNFTTSLVNQTIRRSAARVPFMGWNNWYQGDSTTFDAATFTNWVMNMVTNGIVEAGYKQLILDDGWAGGRDSAGTIYARSNAFPAGFKASADWAASFGVKLGVYSEPNALTLAMFPGSAGHIEEDAATFQDWGVEYLKWDMGGNQANFTNVDYSINRMANALDWYSRPVILDSGVSGALANQPSAFYAGWRRFIEQQRALNYYRCVDPIGIGYDSNIEATGGLNWWISAIHSYDLTMLRKAANLPSHGILGDDIRYNGNVESTIRGAFSIWAGCGFPLMTRGFPKPSDSFFATAMKYITNRTMITIAQDPWCATPVICLESNVGYWWSPGADTNNTKGVQVVKRPLGSSGDVLPPAWAVTFINRETNLAATISLNWTNLGVPSNTVFTCFDVWAETNIVASNSLKTVIGAADARLWIFSNAPAATPYSTSVPLVGSAKSEFYPNNYQILSSAANSGIYTNGDIAPAFLQDYRINGSGYWAFGLRIPSYVTQSVTRITMNWSAAVPLHGTNVFTTFQRANLTTTYPQLNSQFIFDLTNGLNRVFITNTWTDTTSQKEIKITNSGIAHTNTSALMIPMVECFYNGTSIQ